VASTGGPPALAYVLGSLPRDLPVPLLLAQHIASGFTAGLVRWFGSVCMLKVMIATEGGQALPGHVYLAPDGCDLEMDGDRQLHTPRSSGLHCPSGNKLLASLARACGSRTAGFVLTGMGDDGAQGLLELKRAGGATYAQDQQTSVVFGMPQAAQACGAAQALLPLESIAPAILELCKERVGAATAARPRG
ncbi:MAG: CheB methylesterase domain-containing protein, partial [Myxococcales bacterium]